MSISFLNTRKSQFIVGGIVGGALVVYGAARGVEGIVNARNTAEIHTAHNLTYRLVGCGVPPGGDGTDWNAIVVMRNGNPDQVDSYSVQVEFDLDGKPLTWTKVTEMGTFDPGQVKTFHLMSPVGVSPDRAVSCKLLFMHNGGPAGDTSPVSVS